MKHDIFEFSLNDMTWQQKAWRVAFLIGCIAVCILDLFYWRPYE